MTDGTTPIPREVSNPSIRTLRNVDWDHWTPVDHATLLFVIEEGRVLLIRKKRGIGRGKINGPGGRIEPGEDPKTAAIREVQEELTITARQVEFAGTLRFQFTDGYAIQGEVFRAAAYDGTPTETDEAVPHWFPIDDLPYGDMWADDEHWMPLLFAGKRFTGRFIFNGDTLLDGKVQEMREHQ